MSAGTLEFGGKIDMRERESCRGFEEKDTGIFIKYV
jgi:hypothetical protein